MKSLLFFSILIFGCASFATSIIPDTRRVIRNAHDTGAAAGWSQRNNINAQLNQYDDEDLDDGQKESISEQAASVFYNQDSMFTVEGLLLMGSYEDKDGSSREYDYDILQVAVGAPIQDKFSIGVLLSAYEDDDTPDDTSDLLSLSASIKVNPELFVGLAYEEVKDDDSSNDYDMVLVGMGHTRGDAAAPTMAGEVYLKRFNFESAEALRLRLEGWFNLESSQPFFIIQWTDYDYDSGSDQTVRYLEAGLDHSFGDVYIIPSITSFMDDDDGDEDVTRGFEFEVGYRQPAWRVFAHLRADRDDYESTTTEEKSRTLTVGGSYVF